MSNQKKLPLTKGKAPVKAAGKVPAKAPATKVKKAGQPSMLDKFESKLSKISLRKHNPKMELRVRIVAKRTAQHLQGYLLKIEGESFVFSHTKPRSSKQTVSIFPAKDVIMYTGAVGERAQITVMSQEVVREIKRANVETRGSANVITNLDTGDVTVFNTSNTDGFEMQTELAE
jgi:hypothetical protein